MVTTYYRDEILVGAIIAGQMLAVVAVVQLLRGLWWLVYTLYIRPPMDPLRHLPGPGGDKFEGHFHLVLEYVTSHALCLAAFNNASQPR